MGATEPDRTTDLRGHRVAPAPSPTGPGLARRSAHLVDARHREPADHRGRARSTGHLGLLVHDERTTTTSGRHGFGFRVARGRRRPPSP